MMTTFMGDATEDSRIVVTSVPDVMAVDDVAVGAGASIVIAVAATLALTITAVVAALSGATSAHAAELPAGIVEAGSALARGESVFTVIPSTAGTEHSLAPLLALALTGLVVMAARATTRQLSAPARIRRPAPVPAGRSR